MSCDWARRQMVLSDSLTADEAGMLEEHVRRCPACARRWQQWERLRAWLDDLPKVTPSSEDRRQLMVHLTQAPPSPAPLWDCPTARRHLWLWLDSELSKEQQFSLIAHLAECDRCQTALWDAEQTLRLVRALPKVTATAAHKAAVKARLFPKPTRLPVIPFAWRIAVPFAAAAAIALLTMTYWFLKPSTTVIADRPTPPVPSAPRFAQRSPTESPLSSQQPRERSVVEKSTGQQERAPERRTPERPMTPKVVIAPTVKPHPKREPVTIPQRVKPDKVIASPLPTPQPVPVQPQPTELPTPLTPPAPTIATLPSPPVKPSPPQVLMLTELTAVAPAPLPPSSGPQLATPSPASPLESEPRRLVPLPPITIERDESLAPPRLQLSVIPPSQQLYRKFGVALTTVPADKRPKRVGEPLSQESSIPLAAERYRSRTALISLWQIGVSW